MRRTTPIPTLLFLATLLLGVNASLGAQSDAPPPLSSLLTEKDLTSGQVRAQLEATQLRASEVGALATDAPGAELKPALERRKKLLEELLGVVEQRESFKAQQQALPSTRGRTSEELARLRTTPAEVPTTVSPQGLEEAEDDLELKRAKAQELAEADRQRRTRLEKFAEVSAKLRERASAAGTVARQRETELDRSEVNKELVTLQLENARLDQRVVEATVRMHRAEEEFERDAVALRELELEVAREEVTRAEAYLSAYQGALADLQAKELAAKAREAKRKEAAAQTAGNDRERFLRAWEARAAKVELEIADLERFKTDLAKEVAAQQKQLDAEKLELTSLEAMLEQLTSREQSAEV